MTGWRWPRFGTGGGDGAIVQSFWHGAPLTPYERLSIKSFLDCGHRYRLFAYRPDLIAPEGCEIADAAEILPEDRVFFYKRGAGAGSVAAFANLFRYKLLFERGGWWVDTDVVCQTRRLPAARYVFGYEPDGTVNNAVLKCPRRARLMRRCMDAAIAKGDDIRWGESGPQLLSRVVAEERLERFVRDSRAFYPYNWPEAERALDPRHAFRLEALCVNATFVHLWNEILRRAGIDKTAPPPEGSYLAGLFTRHAVTFDG